MRARKRYEINYRLKDKPHLKLLETSVHEIPERIEEYDKDMFVVFNVLKQKYELHSIEYAVGDTFQTTIPFNELDVRTIQHLYDNDIRVHGKKIFQRIEEAERQEKVRQKRDFKNWVEAVASETKSLFAKDAWNM